MECILCGKTEQLRVHNNMNICNKCYDGNVATFNNYTNNRIIEQSMPSKIIDNLYIGDIDSAVSKDFLAERNITNVLIAGKYLDNHSLPGIEYLNILVDDSLEQDINQYFNMCMKFIDNAQGATLVHCYSGISRSGTIIIAYLMYKNKCSYEEAYTYAVSKHSAINPNSNFVEQLKNYNLLIASNLDI